MDRQEMVRELTRKGILVTPDMLDKISSDTAGGGEQAAQGMLLKKRSPKKKLTVTINKTDKIPRISAADFVAYYNARYDGLRKILLTRMKAVSINKALESYSDVSVIGMVKQKNPRGFLLEDTTGEIEIVGETDAEEDDVIGIRGTVREGRLLLAETIWPDIPDENTVHSIPELSILFTTFLNDKLREVSRDMSLVFIPGKPDTELTDEEKPRFLAGLPDPCHIVVKKDGKEFYILKYGPDRAIGPGEASRLLKRRHLCPERREIYSRNDPYLLENVPDVVWIITEKRHVERYRGVTVIMSKQKDAVKYDAGTGQVFFAYE